MFCHISSSLWAVAFHFLIRCWWWIVLRCSMGCEFALLLPDFQCNQLLGRSSLLILYLFVISRKFCWSSEHNTSIKSRFMYSRSFLFHFHLTVPFSLLSVGVFCLFTRRSRQQESRFSLRSISVQPAVDVSATVFWINVWLFFYFSAITVSNVLLWVFCLFHFQRFLIFGLLSTVCYICQDSRLISRICRQRVSDTLQLFNYIS